MQRLRTWRDEPAPKAPPATATASTAPVAEPVPADAATAPVEGPRYPVRLSHAYAAGDRYRIIKHLEAHRAVDVDLGDEIQRQESHTEAELVAEAEVLQVDGRGQGLRTRYTVEVARVVIDGDTTALPRGGVLTVQRGAEPAFTLDEGTLSEGETYALTRLLPVQPPPPHTDDAVFGPTGPRSVGAHWPADLDKLAADFARRGMPLGRRSRAHAELVAARPCGPHECLEVAMHMKLDLQGLPRMPANTRMARARMRLHAVKQMPVDPQARVARSEETSMQLEARLTVHSGHSPLPMHTRAWERASVVVEPL